MVGWVIVHSTVSDEIFKVKVVIEGMDIPQGKDSGNAVVTVSLDYSHVYREAIGAIGSGNSEESASVEPLVAVAIPAPGCLGVREASFAGTVVDTFRAAVTDFDAVMACPRFVR